MKFSLAHSMRQLVVVESPAKAKLIQQFLGSDFVVKASMGHVRDLPEKKADLSPAQRKLPYASLAVDVEHDFKPLYVIKSSKKDVIDDLRDLMKNSSELWVATDEDREGEAIGYHITVLLKVPAEKIKRIVFHEITKKAILEAMENPRSIDGKMVDAQQARRILDRLVGYKLSPLIWSKIRYGLSAGRVQSVAVRLVVEKDREVEQFNPKEFWKLKSRYETPSFEAELVSKKITSADEMKKALSDLQGKTHTISNIEQKDSTSSPPPPYTTSTLQQDASTKLGFSLKQTMVIAQKLYEGNIKKKGLEKGLITYMRTDSVNLSDFALKDIREMILENYGQEFALEQPRRFKTKSKSAQEAHEAIRPTDMTISPTEAKLFLDSGELRLYSLIWRRTMASQMAPARLKRTTVTITAHEYAFRAEGQMVEFPGYLKVGTEMSKERFLPALSLGMNLPLANVLLPVPEGEEVDACALIAYQLEPKIPGLLPEQHFTKPPARYTEASLVKKLESLGIGRPSTYAPTITTIQTRGYVIKKEDKKLYSTDTGKVVTDFLVKHFSDILSYNFTALLEEELDDIAGGTLTTKKMLEDFYRPFEKLLEEKKDEIKKEEVITQKTDIVCSECQRPMEIKLGRFGKFLSCTGYPECKAARPLNPDGTPGEAVKPEITGEKCPDCGFDLLKRQGRFGPFVGCSQYPKCKYIKKEEKKIGIHCVVCENGEMIEKKTRRGKLFFSCNNYPKCQTAFWDKPLQKTCPHCGEKQLLVLKKVPRKNEWNELCPVCVRAAKVASKKET